MVFFLTLIFVLKAVHIVGLHSVSIHSLRISYRAFGFAPYLKCKNRHSCLVSCMGTISDLVKQDNLTRLYAVSVTIPLMRAKSYILILSNYFDRFLMLPHVLSINVIRTPQASEELIRLS